MKGKIMNILPMIRSELQDTSSARWPDSVLERYVDEANTIASKNNLSDEDKFKFLLYYPCFSAYLQQNELVKAKYYLHKIEMLIGSQFASDLCYHLFFCMKNDSHNEKMAKVIRQLNFD